MPELPEVETLRRSLLPLVVGRRIVAVDVRERRLRRPIPAAFAARLRGQRIEGIERRAKYLLFHLDGGECMLLHLGMSGSLVVQPRPVLLAPHDHVRWRLSDGAEMVLNDPRRFGLLTIVPSAALAHAPELRRLGVDPLDPTLTAQCFAAVLRRGRRPIKNVLLDQAVLAGLGNIYANEALFRAGLRPTRRVHRVRRTEVAPLLAAIRAVLEDALASGGSSISDYRDGTGRAGYFQLRLRVYDREHEACPCCGSVIRRVVQAGRSSFYCPRCQR